MQKSPRPTFLQSQAQWQIRHKGLYFCVVWVPAPKTAWSPCKAGCSQQRGAGAAGLSCAACRMLSALGQSRWKQSRLFFICLPLFLTVWINTGNLCSQGSVNTPKQPRRALLQAEWRGQRCDQPGKLSGCVLCQGTFSTLSISPAGRSHRVNDTPGLYFSRVIWPWLPTP